MLSFSDGILAKAKTAANAEELVALAKESGIDLTQEEAQFYFARLNPPSGELADEELDNVSGGACATSYTLDGVRLTQSNQTCEFYQCKCCEGPVCRYSNNSKSICLFCRYFEYGLPYGQKFSLCMNPRNFRK